MCCSSYFIPAFLRAVLLKLPEVLVLPAGWLGATLAEMVGS